MGLFDIDKNEDYTIIVGCGRLGANLASELSDNGENVLIIDRHEGAFRKLSPSYGGLTLVGEATDLYILREADADRANTFIAVTNNDNANIMAAQLAKETFKTARVVVRLYDPEKEIVYRGLGIDTVCPTVLSSKEINRILTQKEQEDEQ